MRVAILIAATVVAGCAYFTSWGDVMGRWVGEPISSITDLWGPPDQTWTREDGKTVYKYHQQQVDPSCYHYWVVDENGVIADFDYEGYCRPVG